MPQYILMKQEAQMRAVPLKQRLPIAVTLSLMLLIVEVIGLGVAIRRGQIVPPTIDLELGIVRIVGYTTTTLTAHLINSARHNPSHHRKLSMSSGAYMSLCRQSSRMAEPPGKCSSCR
jgi:hypothetical protein